MNGRAPRQLDRSVDALLRAAPRREGRAAAVEALARRGLPRPDIEEWRHTPLGELAEADLHSIASADDGESARGELLAGFGWAGEGTVVANGHPVRLPAPPPGVSTRMVADGEVLEPGSEWREADGFSLLNEALHPVRLHVAVAAGVQVEAPLELWLVASSSRDGGLALPRVSLDVGEGASVRLRVAVLGRAIGSGSLSSEVLRGVIGPGASVELARVGLGDGGGAVLADWSLRQRASSSLMVHAASCGGRLSRLSLGVDLAGEGSVAEVNAVYLADRGETVDHHFCVRHSAPRCRSRMVCRGIVGGGGRAVFDGHSLVSAGAVKSEAVQESRNLLLSDDAIVHAKPHLEIDNDDVVCGHGATVGRLDDAALFYLRSRGMGEEVAKAVLTHAFLGESMERMAGLMPRAWLDVLRQRLPGAAELGEVERDLEGWS